jgi:hypothetical protein
VVYYVLGLCLFFGDAYEEVMRLLVAGLHFTGAWQKDWQVPTTGAISQARQRLGAAPLQLLFERVAVPCAQRGTRGAWLGSRRLMAIDGFVLDVPDTKENDTAFGRSGGEKNPAPFPQVRLVGLGECGTHAIVAARLAAWRASERALAGELVADFEPGMLIIADRGFYSWNLWQAAAASGADLLWRMQDGPNLPVVRAFPDGSYESFLLDPKVRGRRATQRHAAGPDPWPGGCGCGGGDTMNALAANDFEAAGLLALARLGELVAGCAQEDAALGQVVDEVAATIK